MGGPTKRNSTTSTAAVWEALPNAKYVYYSMGSQTKPPSIQVLNGGALYLKVPYTKPYSLEGFWRRRKQHPPGTPIFPRGINFHERSPRIFSDILSRFLLYREPLANTTNGQSIIDSEARGRFMRNVLGRVLSFRL